MYFFTCNALRNQSVLALFSILKTYIILSSVSALNTSLDCVLKIIVNWSGVPCVARRGRKQLAISKEDNRE